MGGQHPSLSVVIALVLSLELGFLEIKLKMRQEHMPNFSVMQDAECMLDTVKLRSGDAAGQGFQGVKGSMKYHATGAACFEEEVVTSECLTSASCTPPSPQLG